jgi:hypothetical protein
MQTQKKAELDGWRTTMPGVMFGAIAGVAHLVAKFLKFAIGAVLPVVALRPRGGLSGGHPAPGRNAATLRADAAEPGFQRARRRESENNLAAWRVLRRGQ